MANVDLGAGSKADDQRFDDLRALDHDALPRQRLVDHLGERWNVSLTVVEAPGGYGKSTAIAQAILDNASDPTGLDVYVGCRRGHREPDVLARAVVQALDENARTSRPATTADVIDAIAHLAPTTVCVVLDDVHHLVGSAAADLVAGLMTDLPTNGRLLLAGRSVPPMPMSRLASGDRVLHLTPDDLLFTDDEAVAVAEEHGADPDLVAPAGGWPALTRLNLSPAGAAGAGSATVEDAVNQHIAGLDDAVRLALAAVVLGRRVNDDFLESVAQVPITTVELRRQVPLLVDLGDGYIRAHDLWVDAVSQLVEDDQLAALARVVSRWHSRAHRHDDAVRVATGHQQWGAARQAVLRAVLPGDALLSSRGVQAWLDAFPADQADEPELLLLRGLGGRLAGPTDAGEADLVAALEGFRARDDVRGELTTLAELHTTLWLLGEPGRIAELVERAEQLAPFTPPLLVHFMRTSELDLSGKPQAALDEFDEIDTEMLPPGTALLALRSRSTFCFLVGDGDGGVEAADALVEIVANAETRQIAAAAHWHNGDPEPMLSEARRPLVPKDNVRDAFLGAVYTALIGASLGRRVDLTPLDRGPRRPRDRTFVALAEAADLLIGASEADAAARLGRLFEEPEVDEDDPVVVNELRRFSALPYILHPASRRRLEEGQLGPLHERQLGLVRLLVTARQGGRVDWTTPLDPAAVLTTLPLPWSIELACRAAAADAPRGVELARALLEWAPEATHERLRARAEDFNADAADGARSILAGVPAPPAKPVVLRACAGLEIQGGDGEPLRRQRVRQLLGLLVLRRRLTRSTIVELLWPDKDESRAANNLRVTLTFLRQALEPDRRKGEAGFHLRTDDDVVELHESAHLQVDLWEISAAIDAGRDLDRAGDHAAAVELYRAVGEWWNGEPLGDLRTLDAVAPQLTGFDLDAGDAVARVGEWALAQGDTDEALEAATVLLARDPFSERAHGIVIGVHLYLGHLDEAEDALAECLAMLTELEVDPSPETRMLRRRLDRRMQRSTPAGADAS